MGRETASTGMTAGAGLRGLALVMAVSLAPGWFAPASAQAPEAAPITSCTKSDFEIAVDEAAASLRDLNNHNRPEFQNRLRELKEKRTWTDDQFMKEAAPFVKDDKIGEFDAKSSELLASISSMGTEGAAASTPDCTMLTELRRLMAVLIETQGAKWAYMFEKLNAEIAK